ncbi:MAG TPA: hypothetical protein VF615_12660 [Longimicrobiaceae bacterium]|jgi:hypothetical protein
MTITLYATFDGEVLRPEEPVPLAPNTRVRLVIETEPGDAVARSSFLRTAQALDLDGLPEWSSRLKAYLYGGQELGRNGAAE